MLEYLRTLKFLDIIGEHVLLKYLISEDFAFLEHQDRSLQVIHRVCPIVRVHPIFIQLVAVVL